MEEAALQDKATGTCSQDTESSSFQLKFWISEWTDIEFSS